MDEQSRYFKVIGGRAAEIAAEFGAKEEKAVNALRDRMKEFGAVKAVKTVEHTLLALVFKRVKGTDGGIPKKTELRLRKAGWAPISKADEKKWKIDARGFCGWKPDKKTTVGKELSESFDRISTDHRVYASMLLGRDEDKPSTGKYGDWIFTGGLCWWPTLFKAGPEGAPSEGCPWVVSHHQSAKVKPVDGLVEIKVSEFYALLGK